MTKEKHRKDGIGATKVNGKTIYEEKPLIEKRMKTFVDYMHLREDIFYAKDVAEAVAKFLSHFTPVDKTFMDAEMFSPREIIEFAKEDFGTFNSPQEKSKVKSLISSNPEDNHDKGCEICKNVDWVKSTIYLKPIIFKDTSNSKEVCECGHDKDNHIWNHRFKDKVRECLKCYPKCKKFKPVQEVEDDK